VRPTTHVRDGDHSDVLWPDLENDRVRESWQEQPPDVAFRSEARWTSEPAGMPFDVSQRLADSLDKF